VSLCSGPPAWWWRFGACPYERAGSCPHWSPSRVGFALARSGQRTFAPNCIGEPNRALCFEWVFVRLSGNARPCLYWHRNRATHCRPRCISTVGAFEHDAGLALKQSPSWWDKPRICVCLSPAPRLFSTTDRRKNHGTHERQ
jgi:hypothetical protein